MKSKKVETLLYSAIGVVVMFAVIVAVNLIAGAARARLDATADKLYSLCRGGCSTINHEALIRRGGSVWEEVRCVSDCY